MAYGRLDIFFPDGGYKAYSLSAATTSLGRAADNTIAIDNATIAPTHIRIRHQDGQTTLYDDDSRGGTFVDGDRIAQGEPYVLGGGEEILIGDLRLIFHLFDDAPTRPITVPEETTQRIEVVAPNYTVDVVGPDQPVAPGAHIAGQLLIHNTSSIRERYTIDVTGIPRDWVRLERSEVEIAPGATEDITLNFKPARRPDSQPGTYRIIIQTRSRSQPDAPAKAEVQLVVLAFSGFGMALEETRLRAGEPFRLYVHNQGSAPLDLSLTTRERLNRLRFNIPNTSITLAPGQRRMIQGTVLPRQALLLGRVRQYPFDLLVKARDASGFLAVVRAYASVRPRLPAWAPLAAIAVLGALLLVVLVIASQLVVPAAATTPPQITAFSSSSSRLTQGQPLTLRWEAVQADSLTLLVNGIILADRISPQSGTLEIDTSAFAGAVLLTLRASNAAGTDEESQALEIIAPLAITYFNIEPGTLVRYVVQSLTLNWSVSGAVSTRLSGLEDFSQSPLPESYGASGTVQIVGIPILPITVRLTAQDSSGTPLEEAFAVEVIDPRCRPAGDPVTLYALPGGSGQVIATLTGGDVTVDAQDASGAWLRALLEGGAEGWAERAQLTCDDTFDPAQLRKDITLPTQPPPTATNAVPPTVTGPQMTTPVVPTATGRFGG